MFRLTAKAPVIAAAFTLLALACGGCTSETEGDGPTDASAVLYVEPAWMAEARQREEKEAHDLVGCLAQAGWEATIERDSGVEPTGPLSSDQEEAFTSAWQTCSKSLFGGGPDRTEAEWRVKYAHALDTRDCLVAHGYTITDPPSEDSWVEGGLAGRPIWAPFESLLSQDANGTIDLTEQTYFDLYTTCPQDGPTVTMRGW